MEGLPLSFDLKIFLFSIVNFVVLFFVLKKVLFVPVYTMLQERKVKIKESLDQMEQVKKEREMVTVEKAQIITQAEERSRDIIQKAEEMKKEIIANGKSEAEKIIECSRKTIEKEREDLKKEMNVLLVDLARTNVDQALFNMSKQDNKGKIEKAILQGFHESPVDTKGIKDVLAGVSSK
ncbi:MAG: ATP synthase F0 subunit B [bacterium]